MSFNGDRARELLQVILVLIQDQIPEGIQVKIEGHGGPTIVRGIGPKPPDRVLSPGDEDYERAARRLGVTDGSSLRLGNMRNTGGGLTIVRGLGSWVPFQSRATKARLTALDALETLQHEVANASMKPWPSEDAHAFADLDGTSIELGFSAGGSKTPVGRILINNCV